MERKETTEMFVNVKRWSSCPTASAGTHSEAVWSDAESDRLRHSGGGHHHRSAPQQPQAAGETHHQDGGGDVRQPGAQEPGAPVRLAGELPLMLSPSSATGQL